jgi:nitrous oxide reductase accessory protein NosL
LKYLTAFLVLVTVLLVGAGQVIEPEDVLRHPACVICGMDRQQYAHSRMLIDYKEGPAGTCSIHCTGADIAVNRHKTIRGIFVADYQNKVLIPAKSAFWVIGGDRSGVMTQRAKWAFGTRNDAERFIKDHGGTLAGYNDAMKATFEDMYADIKMVRDRHADIRMAREQRKRREGERAH